MTTNIKHVLDASILKRGTPPSLNETDNIVVRPSPTLTQTITQA